MAGKVNRVKCTSNEKDVPLAGSKVPPTNNSESAMDEYFTKLNLYRKPIVKDGSCLFRVVAEQVYHTQAKHYQVRLECINFMHLHREYFESFIEGSFEHHLFLLKSPEEWAGQVEISALSQLYKCDFIVYQGINSDPCPVTCNGYDKKILLSFSNGNHYDALYPIQFKSNAAMVQSILYDLIINTVFPEIGQLDDIHSAAGISSSGISYSGISSSWTQVKASKVKMTENSEEKNYRQIQHSLDPNIYRNIEFDVWEESKNKLQQHDRSLAMSLHFKPGDLCFATIKESEDISKTIRVRFHEIQSDKCIVLSENLKHRYFVRLEDIKLITNENEEYYKNLPGYYNKNENDSDFLQPKRRPKGRREKQEDRNRPPRNGEQKKRHEKDNFRRGKKDDSKKKDSEDVKLKLDSVDLKDGNKRLSPILPATPSSDVEVKVAHPAESSAAFWGRMRVKPANHLSPNLSDSNHKPVHLDDVSVHQNAYKNEKSLSPSKDIISPVDIKHLHKNSSEGYGNHISNENDVKIRSEIKSPISNGNSTVKMSTKVLSQSKLPAKNCKNPPIESFQTQNLRSADFSKELSFESSELSKEELSTVSDKCLPGESPNQTNKSNARKDVNKEKSNKDILMSNTTNSFDSYNTISNTSSPETKLDYSTNIFTFTEELKHINKEETVSDVQDDADSTTDNSEESAGTEEIKDRKIKKKVSFATDTEIISSSASHSSTLYNENLNCEPGKIKLPPEHIEKHTSDQPFNDRQQNVLQASYNGPFVQQIPLSGMLPMYYQSVDQVIAPVAFSYDLEGKDLPEDIATVRHFFNLGVQWYYMMVQQQQNGFVNQPNLTSQAGILPLPLQTQIQLRHSLMTSDINTTNQLHDSYLKKENDLANGTHQQAQIGHQVFFVPPNTYEQYELPPRMKRDIFPRQQNNRYVQPRFYNHRNGIVENVSRTRMEIQKGIPPHGMNFHSY
uniref:OTU domain-containing protein 4 n=1 Tax=Hydra vulgaris TaxID=6087 RepID=T2MDP5_HYDVU